MIGLNIAYTVHRIAYDSIIFVRVDKLIIVGSLKLGIQRSNTHIPCIVIIWSRDAELPDANRPNSHSPFGSVFVSTNS